MDAPGSTTPRLAFHFLPLIALFTLYLGSGTDQTAAISSLYFNGHVSAAGFFLISAIVNHIRRILVPALGQFLHRHPVEALKLARSSPHLFVEEGLAMFDSRSHLFVWSLQVLVVGVVQSAAANLIARVLAEDAALEVQLKEAKERLAAAREKEAQHCRELDQLLEAQLDSSLEGDEAREQADEARAAMGFARSEIAMAVAAQETEDKEIASLDIYTRHGRIQCANRYQVFTADISRVLFLSCTMATIEYAFSEATWFTASLYAYATTLTSPHLSSIGHARSRYVVDMLRGSPVSAVLQLLMVLYIAWYSLRPKALLAGKALLEGKMALPVFLTVLAVGMGYVVRHSNYFFLALEMSDMLLTWAWMWFGLFLVGVSKYYDAGMRFRGLTEPAIYVK